MTLDHPLGKLLSLLDCRAMVLTDAFLTEHHSHPKLRGTGRTTFNIDLVVTVRFHCGNSIKKQANGG